MKKNQQYHKSKKRVMSRHQQNSDKLIAAIRVAHEVILGGMQMAILANTPRPKYDSGVVGETDNHAKILSDIKEYNEFFASINTHCDVELSRIGDTFLKTHRSEIIKDDFFVTINTHTDVDLPRMSDFEIENINSLLNERRKVQVTP